MRPFDDYPLAGRVLLDRPSLADSTCRHGYGLDFQRKTGQTHCAYCGTSLVDDFHHWLLMSLDHVVPESEFMRLGIPVEFGGDCINLVLACSGCNGFRNRFKVSIELLRSETDSAWTIDEFVTLRDAVFNLRYGAIEKRRIAEQLFFHQKPSLSARSLDFSAGASVSAEPLLGSFEASTR